MPGLPSDELQILRTDAEESVEIGTAPHDLGLHDLVGAPGKDIYAIALEILQRIDPAAPGELSRALCISLDVLQLVWLEHARTNRLRAQRHQFVAIGVMDCTPIKPARHNPGTHDEGRV